MNKSEIDIFLKKTQIATLVTLNSDGSPNAMPLWYEWNGEKLRMFSSHNTGKIRRLKQDNRACVAVHDPVGVPEAWVTVEGTIELKDTEIKDNTRALRNLAQDKLHRTIVRSQYDK